MYLNVFGIAVTWIYIMDCVHLHLPILFAVCTIKFKFRVLTYNFDKY